MLSLRYSALSKDDLNEIVRFIAKDKPFAARPWVEKIRAKCRLAAKHPGIGDDRSDLGDGIHSFDLRRKLHHLLPRKRWDFGNRRIRRGDHEFPFL